jgi:hypothetical protein
MTIRTPALLLLAAAALAACTADTSTQDAAVAELTADVQRLRVETEKQRDRIAKLERQIGGLQTDVVRVREISGGVSEAPVAPGEGSAASGGPSGGPSDPAAGGAGAVPDSQAMRTFFGTEEGRKVLTAAMRIAQDQQEQERTARMVEGMLARFAKDAELTDDQTKKMRDILGRSTGQMRELMVSMRDPPADLTGEARDQARQQTMAKIGEVRQAADAEIKSVLSQTQYDAYQKSFPQGTGGFGGGPGGPPRRAN